MGKRQTRQTRSTRKLRCTFPLGRVLAVGGIATAAACATEEGVGDVQQTICLPGDTECCNCNVPTQPCCCNSPIILDLAGDGVKLTSWQEGVADFPLRPWEPTVPHAWTEPGTDDAWLTWDSNEDGLITSGIELFGDAMPQAKPPQGEKENGFLALTQHDDNDDRVIDQSDFVYHEIRLWQDQNQDGVSQSEELHRLLDKGIAGLSVDYAGSMKADEHGNAFRWSAPVYNTPGSTVGMTAWDVLLTSPTPAEQKKHGITPIPRRRFPSVPPPEVVPAPEERIDTHPSVGLIDADPSVGLSLQEAALGDGVCFYRRHIWEPFTIWGDDGAEAMQGRGNWDLNITLPCDANQAAIRMQLRNQWEGTWHYVATKTKTVPEYNNVIAEAPCNADTEHSYWQTTMRTYLLGCPTCSPIDLGIFNAFSDAAWRTCNSFQTRCEEP